jgi:iron complex transport system substrate-binding protein
VISYGLNMTSAQDLEAAGIKSIVNAGFCDGTGSGPNPDGDVDCDDVYADIELYGRIFGTEAAATQMVADLRRRVTAVRDRFRNATSSVSTAAGLHAV